MSFFSTNRVAYPMPSALGRERFSSAVRGFTLIELLVAATIALSVMAVVASLFALFGRAASNGQSVIDMSARMRAAGAKLSQDLKGVTARLAPSVDPESATGYFELIEGTTTDASSTVGDCDDALLFTTRSPTRAFAGRFNASQIESSTAEVAWFCRPTPVGGASLYTVYRRQLIVTGYVGAAPFYVSGSTTNNQIPGTLPAAYNLYDLSLRASGAALVPNTLADLTIRANRFLHSVPPCKTCNGTGKVNNDTCPDCCGTGQAPPIFSVATPGTYFDSASGREGEDIVLTNVLAFDVRVFDPKAQSKINGTTVLYPTDPGYSGGTDPTGPIVAPATTGPFLGVKGCFIDLGQANLSTILSSAANPGSGLTSTYDTWSTHYESDGNDDDGDGAIDEGTDGLDSDGDNMPDELDEAEKPAPYAVPLSGIEILIRCYDPISQQVRQITVRQVFSQ